MAQDVARDVTTYKMYEQIQRQPDELERLLSASEPVEEAATLLLDAERVITVGIGTSSNAASSAAYLLRAAGIDAVPWSSYDFSFYGPALRGVAAIVFSHTGRKGASKQALHRLKEAHIPAVWIAGAEPEPNVATVTLHTVPREPSSAYTLSHTAAMLLTARIVDQMQPGSIGDVAAVPAAVRTSLNLESALRDLAADWHEAQAIVAVGGGPHESSAHEVAIKINEAARMRARGYAVEQFLHGPQAQMQAGDALLLFASIGAALERSSVVAQFGIDVGARVAWISPESAPDGAVELNVPDVGEWLAPIVQAVPGQLLAAHLAARHGVDADSFRLDDPPFKRAFERYDL